MWSLTSLLGVFLVSAGPGGLRPGSCERTTYAFTRDVRVASMTRRVTDARRVFGGAPAQLSVFPGVVALLDRYWAAQCSGSWLSEYWTLTAAHCVTARLAYVRYNARRPHDNDGDVQPVLYLYRHPKFKVVQEDEGRGEDVTLLHHDIGLVRTRRAMTLRVQPSRAPLVAMRTHAINELSGQEVTVLGFGDTGGGAQGSELYGVRLRLVWCERGAWYHCVCAVSTHTDPDGGGGTTAGVCAGDSGGPVVGADGVQLAVTSMGPMSCATRAGPPHDATSVLTVVAPYVTLLNATMRDADVTLLRRMHARAQSVAVHHILIVTTASISFVICLR